MNAIVEQSVPNKVVKAQISSGGRVAAIVPQDIDQTFRLAGAIAMSQMAPKSYGNDEKKIFVGILAGMEIGLTPMAALQSIAVIGNMPAIWGDGALALVQASGLLDDFEETDDGETATCRAVRKGSPTPIVRTFSIADAKVAGLANKTGPWMQYPKRMRQMRARLLVLRDGFADVLKGMRIAEEVQDYPKEAFLTEVQPQQRLTRAALQNQVETTQGQDVPYDAETDSFVTPTEQGEAFDADTGEVVKEGSPPDHPAHARAAEIIAEIAACADVSALNAKEDEHTMEVSYMPDDIAETVMGAFAARLEELTPAQ